MVMYVQSISPANKAQGYKIGTESFLSTFRRWLQKQTNKRKHALAQLTRLCTLWHRNEERSIEIRYTRLPGPWGLFCTSKTGLPPRTSCLGKLHRRIKLISQEHKTWLLLNPFAPGDFAEETRFEAIRVVFWSLSCYKKLKLTTNQFTARTLHGLLIHNRRQNELRHFAQK